MMMFVKVILLVNKFSNFYITYYHCESLNSYSNEQCILFVKIIVY